MTLTKTVKIDDSALQIISNMQWQQNGQQWIGVLTGGQLDRKLYEAVNKGLDLLGGKWNRSKGGHLFATDPRQQIEAMLGAGTVTIEKDGFFRTPKAVAEQMIEMFERTVLEAILEPSAGDGAICDVLRNYGYTDIVTVEHNELRRNILRSKGYKVDSCTDFLEMCGNFSTIIMNPPFEQSQDMDHVTHAFNNCLAQRGQLVSVMAEGAFFRDDRKAMAFRDLLDSHGYSEALDAGAFKESGTMVSTRLVYLRK